MSRILERFVPGVALFMAAVHVVLWPLDRYLLAHDPALVSLYGRWRVLIAGLALGVAAGVWLVPAIRRHTLVWGIGIFGVGTFLSGLFFSPYGGLETPFFYFSYYLLFVPVILPMPLAQRVGVTLWLSVCWLTSYFGARPEHLADEYAGLALSGWVVVVFAAVGGGHALFHLARENFLSRRQLAEQTEALREANEKAERLLLNVLPAPIAARLKEQPEAIADRFAEVTVLFADLCDFTPLAESMSAEALVSLLNDVFSDFDHLAEKHGLEKIKTIGDAYMLAAGLPQLRADHTSAVAAMALDMVEAARRFRTPGGEPLRMRIGIHSGPVIAGVIGVKRFIYDLWGDTVNIASRMESHGLPGEIQVSESAAERLRADYELEDRGEVAIKGKGTQRTYLLRGRRAEGTTEAMSAP